MGLSPCVHTLLSHAVIPQFLTERGGLSCTSEDKAGVKKKTKMKKVKQVVKKQAMTGDGDVDVDDVDDGELEPDDTLLSDLPHLVFHMTSKTGCGTHKIGRQKKIKTHTR